MIEVRFKHKNSKHGLHINGKRIQFEDGKAYVSEADAEAILKTGDEDYKVLNKAEPAGVVLEDKPKSKPKKTKKGKGKSKK